MDSKINKFIKRNYQLNKSYDNKDKTSVKKKSISLLESFENVCDQLRFQFDLHKPVILILKPYLNSNQ
jgi:hypothetical protein